MATQAQIRGYGVAYLVLFVLLSLASAWTLCQAARRAPVTKKQVLSAQSTFPADR